MKSSYSKMPTPEVAISFCCTISVSCLLLLTSFGKAGAEEICHNQYFSAKCPDNGDVILMTTALYGRMRSGSCVKTDFGFIDCYVDVLPYAHERCSGRPSCSIRVPDATLDRTKPCNEDLKSYLEANFTCIKGAPPSGDSCELTSIHEDSPGYISNRSPISPGTKACGTEATPWIIKAQPGQRINVTLLDFTYVHGGVSSKTAPVEAAASPRCDQFVFYQDSTATGSTAVCGGHTAGRGKESHIYMSTGNDLKLVVSRASNKSAYNFLVRYNAVGCPEIETPPRSWIKRDNNRLTVGCQESDESWQFFCVGTRWEGPVASGNCTTGSGSGDIREVETALSIGASILVILAVSLAIGITVLLFGVCYMRRKRFGHVIGHQEQMAMRELKPLSSDDAIYDYDATSRSVYARNGAFEPVKINVMHSRPIVSTGKRTQPKSTGSTCASSVSAATAPTDAADAPTDYEYVWEAKTAEGRTRRGATPSPGSPAAPGTAFPASVPTMVFLQGSSDSRPDLLKVTTKKVVPASIGHGVCPSAPPATSVCQTLPRSLQMPGVRVPTSACMRVGTGPSTTGRAATLKIFAAEADPRFCCRCHPHFDTCRTVNTAGFQGSPTSPVRYAGDPSAERTARKACVKCRGGDSGSDAQIDNMAARTGSANDVCSQQPEVRECSSASSSPAMRLKSAHR